MTIDVPVECSLTKNYYTVLIVVNSKGLWVNKMVTK